jgi:uncharacterized protein YeaO (DUF488 family)
VISAARVYDHPTSGHRVLVDRLWPRGVRKDGAPFDEWLRDVAPSDELRHWYHHEPELYAQFDERYRAELSQPRAAEALEHLRAAAAQGDLVLVTAVREVELSHVAVLQAVLGD